MNRLNCCYAEECINFDTVACGYCSRFLKPRIDNFVAREIVSKIDACKDCICSNCKNNAGNYADGMCRECECCKEDGKIDEAQRCRDYKRVK